MCGSVGNVECVQSRKLTQQREVINLKDEKKNGSVKNNKKISRERCYKSERVFKLTLTVVPSMLSDSRFGDPTGNDIINFMD